MPDGCDCAYGDPVIEGEDCVDVGGRSDGSFLVLGSFSARS